MYTLDYVSRYSQRRIAPLPTPGLLIADHQDARLVFENLTDAVHAEAPEFGNLCRGVVAFGEWRSTHRNLAGPESCRCRHFPCVHLHHISVLSRYRRHLIAVLRLGWNCRLRQRHWRQRRKERLVANAAAINLLLAGDAPQSQQPMVTVRHRGLPFQWSRPT